MTAWKKTFAFAFIAQVLSISGFTFALPFVPFFLEDLGITDKGDQALWAGIVMAAAGITLAIFSPLWGALADRYGRKRMVVRSMLGGTLVLWLMSLSQTVGQLIACRLLQGALTGTVVASVALVASVTPAAHSGFTLGMMQTAVFIGVSIGPLLGGLVADAMGYRMAFRIGALVVLFGGMLVWYGTHESFTPPDRKRDGGRASFLQIIRAPGFLAAVAVLFSIRLSNTISNPSFPLIVKEILTTPARLNSITGMIICSAAVAGAISSALLGHFGDKWGHRRVLMSCTLAAAVVSAAHVFADSIAYLFVVRTVFGLAIAGMIPAANAIIRHSTEDRHLGRAYGVATSISMAGFAIGPVLGGFVGQTMGLRVPFLLTAAGQIIVAVVVAVFVHKNMGRPAPNDLDGVEG